MEPVPPRFSPDNSPEARAQRIAQTSDFSYDHALAWVKFINVVEKVTEPRQVEQK